MIPMPELRDQMRRDAEALRSTRRCGEPGMDRVEAFERLFRQLPQLVGDLERAEAAIERAKTTITALRHMAAAALDDGDTGLSDDHYAGVERAADAIAAALGRPPAEKEEDPNGT